MAAGPEGLPGLVDFNDLYSHDRASFTSDDLVKYQVSITKKFVIEQDEVELEGSFEENGYRKGLYDFPNSVVSWGLTEIAPGVRSPFHRQLHEATHFILEGQGYSVINGVRFDWEAGDVVFVPIHSWHQNVNSGRDKVRYVTAGTVPFFTHLGTYRKENHREPSEDELARLRKEMPPTVVVKRKDWVPRTESGNPAIFPFPCAVSTNRMAACMPPRSENKFVHRHFTEALIYIMKGRGFSLVHDRKVDWKAGSVIRVPTYSWHTHVNPNEETEIHLRHVSSSLNNHLKWNLIDNLSPRDIEETPLAGLAAQVKKDLPPLELVSDSGRRGPPARD